MFIQVQLINKEFRDRLASTAETALVNVAPDVASVQWSDEGIFLNVDDIIVANAKQVLCAGPSRNYLHQ